MHLTQLELAQQRTAVLAFILLFPGFVLYHSLLGLSIIPPFAGGYFSWAAVLSIPVIGGLFLLRASATPGYVGKHDSVFVFF
jgi:hypothetical protein